jgi:hypothetical protein
MQQWVMPQVRGSVVNVTLELGEKLIFNKLADLSCVHLAGFSDPEDEFTWTCSKSASISFALEQSKNLDAIEISIDCAPFLCPPSICEQITMWYFNGLRVHTAELTSSSVQKIVVPSSLVQEVNTIIVDVPDAIRPINLGVGDDERVLGLQVFSLELNPVQLKTLRASLPSPLEGRRSKSESTDF